MDSWTGFTTTTPLPPHGSLFRAEAPGLTFEGPALPGVPRRKIVVHPFFRA